MLRHCLIHPVAPLLSLLAPLFRPFFSPVRGVPNAADPLFKPWKSHSFCATFRRRAGGKGVFPPVIWAKTGERTLSCRREAMGWSEDPSWKLDYSNIERLSQDEIRRRRQEFDRQKEIAKEVREQIASP